MNANRNIKRIMALAMAGTVLASSIISDVSATEQTGIEKEETIYVKTDAAGTAEDVIVSDWLKNQEQASELQDTSLLTDIENVKGDETFTQDGENITWEADGNDIYYQGKTDKELPVTVSVVYYLNGTEISPEDIAGKSGHVKICYQYDNKLKSGDVYVPFMLVTGMILDNEHFRNIEVTNGKNINDGNRNIVIGFGLPGLKDSLDLDISGLDMLDLDIPDGFTIEADVTDFSSKIAMTVATPLDLSDMGLDDVDSWDDLKDKMEELEDGITQLVDGSGELADGVQTLKDGCEELLDGMTELDDGAADLNDGAAQLDGGMTKLDEGIGTLNTRKKDLVDGVKELSDGLNTLNTKKKDLIDGVAQLAEGASSLDSGAATLRKGMKDLYSGITTLDQNRPELISGIQALIDGVNQLEKNKSALTTGAKSVSDGISTVDTNLKKLQSGSKQVTDGLKQINGTVPQNLDQIAAGLKQISDGIDQKLESGDTEESLEALTTTLGGYMDGVTQYINAIYNQEDGSGYISDVDQAFSGMKQVDTSLGKLIEQLENAGMQPASDNQGETENATTVTTKTVNVEVSFADANAETIAALESSIAGNQAVLDSLLDVQAKKESIPDELLTIYSGAYSTYSAQLDNCIAELQNDIANEQASLDALKQTQTVETTVELETYGTDAQADDQPLEIVLGSLRELKSATAQIVAASEQIEAGYHTALPVKGQAITQGGVQIKEGMATALTEFTGTLTTELTAISGGVKQINAGVTMLDETLYGTEETEGVMTALEMGSSQVTDGLKTMENSVSDQLVPGAKALSDGISILYTKGIDLIADGLNQLGGKLPALNTGIVDLKHGAAALYSGTGTLKSGTSQLVSGTTQLQSGANELAIGVQQLADGGNSLKSGVGTLAEGIQDLKDGSSQLKDGTASLADGTSSLKEGTEKLKEGGTELNDGAQELLDGANELRDGVKKFNEEGVEKITDFVDKDLQDIIDRLKELQDVSGSYKSFGSENDEYAHSVKFIIETKGIE